MSANSRVLINQSKVTMGRPPIVIGRGAMGEVYLATYQGKDVVVKKSQRDIMDNTLLKEYSNYFKLQNHNNILKFYGVIRDDQYSFSLVLEYALFGNLSSYLKTHTVGWATKAKICRDISLGLMHCHDNNVLHFDLKPENILLDKNLVPKLADFGIAKTRSQVILDNGKAGGTMNYVAPERVCRDAKMREFFDNHPKLSDIYSFGLILWSVSKNGEHPYEEMDDEYIKEQKRSAHSIHKLLNQLPDKTPTSYHQLIYDLTKYYPNERLELAIARLELESLFDDDEEEHRKSSPFPLDIDGLVTDDEEEFEGSVAGSEQPVSTSTTIESDKPSTTSSSEIIHYENKSSTASSSAYQQTPSRKPSKQSSYSENNNHSNCNVNTTYNKAEIIHDEPFVTSPINTDKNPMIEFPALPSFNADRIINSIYCKVSGVNHNTSCASKYNKHDSGISVGSPTSPKNPSNEELALINEVIAICNNWEKYTDEVMRRKLDLLCHDKGYEPKDLLEIFEKCQTKIADYYFVIGFMSEHAFGKRKDPSMAFENYNKAAELGDPRGLVFVGWCYYKGMGTTKDPQKAFDCFQKASNNGCVSAHNNVGWCYDIGFGTSSNPYKAFECFKSSAEKGYTTAQCRVGVCYEYGRGTHKDLDKALEWYTKAAENGHETAKRRVSELSKRRDSRRRSLLATLSNLFR